MKRRADMHIHGLNDTAYIVELLKKAQEEKLNAISIVRRNSIDIYQPGGALYELAHAEGGISKYFSGKVIPGVEMTCTITNAPVCKSGMDYNKYMIHMLLYGFDPAELSCTPMLNKESVMKRRSEDLTVMLQTATKMGLTLPTADAYSIEAGDLTKQIYNSIPEEQQGELEKQGIKNGSLFARDVFENPNSDFYVPRKDKPTVMECLKTASGIGITKVLAHPFYMNKQFDVEEYINIIRGLGDIDGLECEYWCNSSEQTNFLRQYARERNLIEVDGSDFQKWKEGNDVPGAPKIGKTKDGEPLFIDNCLLRQFPDVRSFYQKTKTINAQTCGFSI